MKLEKIVRQIESNNPAIGIGTAAGASGILATRLLIKVARKSKLEELRKESERVKRKLGKLIREDIKAYTDYIEAYKAKDEERIEQALKYAIETPIKIAEQGYKTLKLSKTAVENGEKSLALEAYGASLLGMATVTAALRVVDLNLKGLKDDKYRREMTLERDILHTNSKHTETEIYLKIFPPKIC